MGFVSALVSIIFYIISALPLHLAVKFLGGKTSVLKTALVVFVGGLVVAAVNGLLKFWAGVIAFILMIAVYALAFDLGWFKAFFAWLLQFVFLILFYFILVVLTGGAFLSVMLL
ncbi:hypothetical protein H6503_05380 [Candidatus Woesearchaeota archaeon]|nr:hypothetical protein [Candidatus Woesearchaeota archaeon]